MRVAVTDAVEPRPRSDVMGVDVDGENRVRGVGVADVHGFCDERFRSIEEAFQGFLDRGVDKGASLAVTLHGEPVVDLWGGTRDYDEKPAWEADTVVRVFSTSKVVLMITVLLLVDRGLLDLDAPIVDYWPDFGRNGKDTMTARQVLLHQSGLPGFGCSITIDELDDWEHVMKVLENAEPGTSRAPFPVTTPRPTATSSAS